MRVGLIARMDKSGLGQGQTLRLYRLLKPEAIMLINSSPFNNNQQHSEWYKPLPTNTTHVLGFPTDEQIKKFLENIDVAITCETFYNNNFTRLAQQAGVKTICIANPEFWDWFKDEWWLIPRPDKVVNPSHWMDKQLGGTYLPTPIFEDEFKQSRDTNLNRKGKTKYLFMNGKTAASDRNGLDSLYEALHTAKGDFTITVKAQNDVKRHPDPRLIYDFSNPEEQYKLYEDFDALILPRRYAGQSLPMCEALQSALPVVMTDIDPNNKILPDKWLVPAYKDGEMNTRIIIELYTAEPIDLAYKLDTLDVSKKTKEEAYELGKQFDAEFLRKQYKTIIEDTYNGR